MVKRYELIYYHRTKKSRDSIRRSTDKAPAPIFIQLHELLVLFESF